ncbi:MAG: sulfate ABC transporter substrate-binding protein [Thermoleophilia bacterium]
MIVRQKSRWLVLLAIAVAAMVAIAAGCGGDDDSSASGTSGGSGGGGTVTIVGYSVAREVYADVISAFKATPEGAGVNFKESYAASGQQSRAVADGLDADYVAFSLEPDMTRLVDAGLVDTDWNAGPQKGFVSDSVVVLITRKGNPKGITGWDDLIKPGVEVITPNPFTSGAAQWNIMAAYGAQIEQGKTEQQGLAYLDSLFKNVPVQPASGREALEVFEAGKGDVLLSYENEAIAAQKSGVDIDYVIPDQTILIQNPVATVNTSKNLATAKAFETFALSAAGQKIFGDNGYRPTDPDVAKQFDYPTPKQLFTIDDLGGWPEVKTKFFDPDNGAVTKIFEGQGIATE